MTQQDKAEILHMIDAKVSAVNSPYSTAGSHNTFNSMLKIDAEIIKTFMDLPFQRQAKVVNFMLKQHKKTMKRGKK